MRVTKNGRLLLSCPLSVLIARGCFEHPFVLVPPYEVETVIEDENHVQKFAEVEVIEPEPDSVSDD